MVRAAQKGEMENPSSEVLDAAGSMKVSDVKKFAKTKHKGLPAKVKEEYIIEREDSPYEKASSGALKGKTRNTEAKEKEHKTSFRRKAHRNSAAMIIRAKRKAERSGKKLSDDSAADLAHKGWASSVKHHKSSMTPEQQKRRQKLADTPYKKLTKDEQDKDKVSAKAIMSVHDQQKKKTVKEEMSDEERRQKKSAKRKAYKERKAKRDATGRKAKNFQSIKSRVKKGKHKLYKLDDVNKPAEKQSMQGVGGFRGVHGASRKSKAAQGKPAPVVYSYKKKEQVNEVIGQFVGGNPVTDMAMNTGMKMNPLLGAVKQKAKKEVKQKSAEVTGNVADKISKPIGGTRVQESKGTAELAGLALRGKKRCAHCGSFTHVTGQCPKKDHGVVNKRTITSEAKEEEGRSDYGKASVRNKRRFGKEGKPAIFDPTNERGKMIDKRREEHQQRQAKSGVTEGIMDIVRKYSKKKKEEKKPQKAMDAGARLRRKVERRVHAKYVSGSEDNVPDDIRDHKTWNDFKKHIN